MAIYIVYGYSDQAFIPSYYHHCFCRYHSIFLVLQNKRSLVSISASLAPVNQPIMTLPHVAIDPLPFPANHIAYSPLAGSQASLAMRIDIYINSPICDSLSLAIISWCSLQCVLLTRCGGGEVLWPSIGRSQRRVTVSDWREKKKEKGEGSTFF